MVIFLFGEDAFRSREKLAEIQDKFLKKNSSGSGLSSFDFEEDATVSVGEIKKALGSRGLFFDKQLVILKNFLTTASKERTAEMVALLAATKNIFDDKEIVIVFWEKEAVNEKNELAKLLLKKATSQKCDMLSGATLDKWIRNRLRKENEALTISSAAAQKLAAYVGNDLVSLQREIEKLANYKNGGTIEEADVKLLVQEKSSSTIFETIEAVSSGDKKRALRLLHEQIQNGEDPIYILMMYVYQFRNFLKIAEHLEKGNQNSYDIAKKTGLHPFVAKKILGQSKQFSLQKLKAIYRKLGSIDEDSKTGKGDIRIALDRFIAEL